MTRALTVVALAVLAALSVAVEGFRFGVGNNALQLPILQRAVNPELFPGDPFVATLGSYTSAFWWVLAEIGRVLQVREWEPVIFGIHVVSRIVMLGAWYLLIVHYVRDRRVVLASVALLALGSSVRGATTLGVHGMIGRVPDHTALATACALLAIAAVLRRRYILAAVLAALTFDINSFVGVWLVPVLTAMVLATREPLPGDRPSPRVWLAAGAAYVVLVAPVALWVLSAVTAPKPPEVASFDYRAFLYDYFPRHFFIDSASTGALIELGVVVCTAVGALVAMGADARAMRVCYAAWLLVFGLGALAPYVTSSALVLNLHLLRVDGLLTLLAGVTAATCAGRVLERRSDSPGALAAGVGILAGLATGYWWLTLAAVAIAGAVLGKSTAIARWLAGAMLGVSAVGVWTLFPFAPRDAGFVVASVAALAGVFVVTRAPAAAAFALIALFGWTQQPKATVLALAALAVGLATPDPSGGARWGRAVPAAQRLLLGAVAVLGLVRTEGTGERMLLALVVAGLLAEALVHRAAAPPAGGRLRVGKGAGTASLVALLALGAAIAVLAPGPKDPFAADLAAWRDVQRWARANSRVGDVFAVPDWPEGFGVFAERSIWVNWKSGAAVMWAPGYHPIYRERRRAQREATDPAAFAAATGVCFAVVDLTNPWETFPRADVLRAGLPTLYRNERFAIVRLCPPDPNGRGGPAARG